MIYCIVPRDLASRLLDTLRRHYKDDPEIEVIVERRRGERRAVSDQRLADPARPPHGCGERRRIRNRDGRRVGERRVALVPVEVPRLPRKARAHAERIVFVERVEPSDRHAEDLDTARLVTRLQAGDTEAFSVLYMRYFDRVYGYLRVALRDAHEAEDAAQAVFVKVIEALPTYERREQPFRAWLFRIVRNHAVDSLRRQQWVEAEDPEQLERRRQPLEDESSMRALQWVSDSELLFFIERLPLVQRQVLVLRYMLDLSTAEIGQILDRTPESIRQTQHRALGFLQARLAALGREPARKKSRLAMHRLMRRRGGALAAEGFSAAR